MNPPSVPQIVSARAAQFVCEHAARRVTAAKLALARAEGERAGFLAQANEARSALGLGPIRPEAPLGDPWAASAANPWATFQQDLFRCPWPQSQAEHEYARLERRAQAAMQRLDARVAAHEATVAEYTALPDHYRQVVARILALDAERRRPGRAPLPTELPVEMTTVSVLQDWNIGLRECQLRALYLKAHLGDAAPAATAAAAYLTEIEYLGLVREARRVLATVNKV